MAKSSKPNILIIWGDDIGYWNISHYSKGMMGYHTPNIDRIAKEGVTFTDWYGQQSCTAGRASFITGQNSDPHRPHQSRHARRHGRNAARRSDHRRTAEAARLRDRSVRQEPSRRSRRISADHARVRRIFRQSLSPQRRGRAGTAGLSQGSGIQEEVWTARRAPLLGRRQGRPEGDGHRPVDQEAHGNHRRGDHCARLWTWMEQQAKAGTAVLPLVQFDSACISGPTLPTRTAARAGRTTTAIGWSPTTSRSASCSTKLDELGIADNTIVMYSTDNGPENDTWPDGANTPFRCTEEHQLGRRLARSDVPALAGQDQAWFGLQRHRLAHRYVPDLAGCRGRSGRRPRSSSTAARSAARTTRSISTATT